MAYTFCVVEPSVKDDIFVGCMCITTTAPNLFHELSCSEIFMAINLTERIESGLAGKDQKPFRYQQDREQALVITFGNPGAPGGLSHHHSGVGTIIFWQRHA